MDNELLLFDRIEKIKQIVNKYGKDKFYISFSGGKDSTILHYLVDMALPNNKIPRVFSNTGIEYNAIVKFVKGLAEKDSRFVIITPKLNIKQMLEKVGYPFKSKEHSTKLDQFQRGSGAKSIIEYINNDGLKTKFCCPKILKYQFTDNFKLKVSPYCCHELKKKPFKKWAKENNKPITITGMRKEEGGQRANMNCVVTKNNEIVKFHPLAVVSEDWEEWFVNKYNIQLCELYYQPYNFKRTGCKGCPFAPDLQEQLDIIEKLLPNERKQCEFIWKPVYAEYRRIGYRLKPYKQLSLFNNDATKKNKIAN